MKTTSLLLLITAILPRASAQATLYLEPRVSFLTISGLPNIGDIGKETGSDLPQLAASIALGYEFSERVSLELRYTHLGDLSVSKVTPNSNIFPLLPDQVSAPVVTNYRFEQRTSLLAAALPIRLWAQEKLTLRITPMLQLESAKVELIRYFPFPPLLPNINSVPDGTPFLRRSTTKVQAAAEIALSYRISERASAQVHYTYSPLSNFDAHLVGAGVAIKF